MELVSVGDRGSRRSGLPVPVKALSSPSILQTQGHVPALDGIRGAAAAAVFIYHYGGGAHSSTFAFHLIGEAIHLCWAGVSLFFVLSGFLITGILLDSLQRPKWWRTFYVRRTLRIFPLYYGALLGVVLVNLLLRTPWSAIFPVWPLFLYLQDIPDLVRMSSLSPLITVGHFWSLAVEEQFYLIWPILLLLASRRGQVRGLCLGVFLVSLIFRICSFGLHLNPGWAGFFIVGRAGEMAAGGFLAASLRCSERERSQVLRGAIPLLVASGVGVMAVILWTKETGAGDPWFGTVGIALLTQLFMALIALCLKPGMTQRIFAFSLLRWLGKISYGIYVYHLLLYPFFAWVAHRILPTSGGQSYLFVLAAVAMVGTLSAAWFSFTFVESRFLRLRSVSVAPACSAHP